MNYGVQKLASVVAFAAGGCTYNVPLFIDKGKHFLIVVAVHFIQSFLWVLSIKMSCRISFKEYQGISSDESP